MMGEAPISLFCVCFNKRASVWCFLLPELIMIGVGRRERAAIGFYEQKTNKINLLCCVNIWGIFWGAIGLNITNKCGTIVQFIYLWDHPPTVHTPNTEYLLRNLNFAPIPKHLIYFSFTSVDHRKAWSGGCLLSWWYLGMLHRPGSHRPNGPGLVTI